MAILRVPGRVSLVIDTSDDRAVITHFGADLGEEPDPRITVPAVPHSAFDEPVRFGVPRQAAEGWVDRESVVVTIDGVRAYPHFRLVGVEVGDGAILLVHEDEHGIRLETRLELRDSGVLEARHAVINGTAASSIGVERLEFALPVRGEELLDLAGRWARERIPQRHELARGTWLRTASHGRTGHDASILTFVGERGFGDRLGAVTGVHLAWSGDAEIAVDVSADGNIALGAGERIASGDVVLQPGERVDGQLVLAAWSPHGIDGVTAAFHAWFRARDTHPVSPRPVVLNTWEAVYFDHDEAELRELADVAASLGVERFVLDDGWFSGRRDDTTSLGDWTVDRERWPNGLDPLIEHLASLGIEFGLWVEPEMISPDSDLARAHPEWIIGPAGRRSLPWRHQHVIDLANPDAFAAVFSQLDALLERYDIRFLKWDQNRDEAEFARAGVPVQHEQTLAVYRLFDELRAAHPGVEIESCSSGGARVDAGILARTDRVWASDSNDALERAAIQRWTEALLPPELIGAHVGPETAHTSGRTHPMSLRTAVALTGHFGIEADVRQMREDELERLREAIDFYREYREVLHGGTLVHAGDAELAVRGVVTDDVAVFTITQLSSSRWTRPPAVRLPGLDGEADWFVTLPFDVADDVEQRRAPGWSSATASGTVLGELGVSLPILRPGRAIVLLAERVA